MTIEALKVDITATLHSMLQKQLRVESEIKQLYCDGFRIEQLNELYAASFDETFGFACEIAERCRNYNDEGIESVADQYKLAVHRCQMLVAVP